MKDDQGYAAIVRWVRDQAKERPDLRVFKTVQPLRRHRENCLGLPSLAPRSALVGQPGGVPVRSAKAPEPDGPVTHTQIIDAARLLLHDRLNDLSAKELHQLVVEGLKTQRAEAAAKAKLREDDDTDEDAVADLRAATVATHSMSVN